LETKLKFVQGLKGPLELHWYGKVHAGCTWLCLIIVPFAYVWHPNWYIAGTIMKKQKKNEFSRRNIEHISAANKDQYSKTTGIGDFQQTQNNTVFFATVKKSRD